MYIRISQLLHQFIYSNTSCTNPYPGTSSQAPTPLTLERASTEIFTSSVSRSSFTGTTCSRSFLRMFPTSVPSHLFDIVTSGKKSVTSRAFISIYNYKLIMTNSISTVSFTNHARCKNSFQTSKPKSKGSCKINESNFAGYHWLLYLHNLHLVCYNLSYKW